MNKAQEAAEKIASTPLPPTSMADNYALTDAGIIKKRIEIDTIIIQQAIDKETKAKDKRIAELEKAFKEIEYRYLTYENVSSSWTKPTIEHKLKELISSMRDIATTAIGKEGK